MPRRIAYQHRIATCHSTGQQGLGLPGMCRKRLSRLFYLPQRRRMGQVKALGIGPLRRKQVRTAPDATLSSKRFERVARHLFRKDLIIHDQAHEGTVRSVFQQTSNQIGQRIAMRANRRINAAATAMRILN